jgi:asparagine synthase (glutamine-hydrolysing)
MIEAQSAYGPHDSSMRQQGAAAFGRALYRLLPEDSYDTQPLVGGNGRYLLTADLRIDNRADLLSHLGIGTSDASTLSDAALLLRSFEAIGDRVLDRLVGDFAFAIWDEQEQRLLLARDLNGQRPLHYRIGNGSFAFSTMPAGLLTLAPGDASIDDRRVAEWLADLAGAPSRSFYMNISQLQPGMSLVWTPAGVRTRRYWSPPSSTLKLDSWHEYIEAFREQIDRATAARLRRASGGIAAHLSSGLDSSTVAATAARLLARENERILAFTAAPRAGFDGRLPKGRIGDESEMAAQTAALHSNIDHIVVRPTERSLMAMLDEAHAVSQHPMGHVCNSMWWFQINEMAQRRGATVMLTGEMGNLTISAGGLRNLGDLVRRGQWIRWLREAHTIGEQTGATWRGVLATSFGPWLPRSVWNLLSGAFLNSSLETGRPVLLNPRWAAVLSADLRRLSRETRPPKDSRRFRLSLMERMNPGSFRKAALARWGVDERDPTADRRVVEFCLALPDDALLRHGTPRPLARDALRDRLPAAVIGNRMKGYQMADWYEQITRQELESLFENVKASKEAASIVNFRRVEQNLFNWPEVDLNTSWVVQDYRGRLLRTLATARFVQTANLTISNRGARDTFG